MPQSTYYNKLLADLVIARKITYSVDPLVCKTTIQDLKVQSYILLSHSAIEQYLESIVLDAATKALMAYVDHQKISRALIGLITSGLIARVEEKGLSKKITEDVFQNIGEFASVAFGRFKSLVGDNNGIKIGDQRKLLLPVGIDPQTEDPATMAALDGFGGKRGAIAHGFKIAKSHTLSEIDSDIETIKNGLVSYDKACDEALT